MTSKSVVEISVLPTAAIIFSILEMEDRCIMASLPYALGDRRTHQNRPGELFWRFLM
jgi:hypothetical protein